MLDTSRAFAWHAASTALSRNFTLILAMSSQPGWIEKAERSQIGRTCIAISIVDPIEPAVARICPLPSGNIPLDMVRES